MQLRASERPSRDERHVFPQARRGCSHQSKAAAELSDHPPSLSLGSSPIAMLKRRLAWLQATRDSAQRRTVSLFSTRRLNSPPRSSKRLCGPETGTLPEHPELTDVLSNYSIKLITT